MTSIAIFVLVVAALSRQRWRRRHDHVPRLLTIGDRQHGSACGCEACVENYAQRHGRVLRAAEDVPSTQIARTRRFIERADADEAAGVLR